MENKPRWRREVEAGRLTDRQFCSFVRKFNTSSVIRQIAEISAERWSPDPSENDFRQMAPWALAEIARVTIGYGNQYRPDASRDDIGWLCAAYTAIEDPALQGKEPGAVTNFMLRLSHTQFGYQLTQYNELVRSIALFTQTTPKPEPELKVLGDGQWQQIVLGCTIPEFVGAASVALAAATTNKGRLNMSWLDAKSFDELDADVDFRVLKQVLTESFVADTGTFKSALGGARPKHNAKRSNSFNPLTKTPIVAGLADDLLVPVPALVLRKASSLGIYYSGVDSGRHGSTFAKNFSTDVGNLFEQYVGRQLGLLRNIELHPEIKYNQGQSKSIDWIAVFPECVVLVEAKSSRPPEGVRTGDRTSVKEQLTRLSEALDQIDHTARLVLDRTPDFQKIPDDRPLIGLAVTMEPWHLSDYTVPDIVGKNWATPATYWSVADLEHFASREIERPGQVLMTMLDAVQDGGNPMTLLNDYPPRQNPILEQAWRETLW